MKKISQNFFGDFKSSNPILSTEPRQTAPAAIYSQSFSKEVADMQSAMINLYETFKYYPMFNKDPNYREENKGYSENYEHGSDPFLTFMLDRYVNKSPTIKNNKAQPANLIKLLESLKTLGTSTVPGKVSKPDGIWGPNTNKGLNNIYAIVQAMLGLMHKLNIDSPNYSNTDLEKLEYLIPEDPSKLKDKDKTAINIIMNLVKIKKLIGDFMNAMDREGGAYSGYIRQEKPFETKFDNVQYNNVDKQILSAPIAIINLPKDIATGGSQVPLSSYSLFSKENFEKFISENQITVKGKDPLKDNEAMNELFNYIERQIKSTPNQK